MIASDNRLTQLKVGDEVVVDRSRCGARTKDYTLDVIARITPRGQYVLLSGFRFNQDGYERTGRDVCWERARLKVPTRKLKNYIRRYRLIDQLVPHLDHWKELPTETLEAITTVFATIAEPTQTTHD